MPPSCRAAAREGRGVTSPGPTFSPLDREMRLSDRVADQLLRAIVDEDRVWQPGDRLPSELALAEQFGVSRTVVREAMRTLASQGVIVRGRGRSGTRVAASNEGALRDSMSLFLRARARWHYGEVHEVRAPLEIEIAGLAAERRTPEDLQRMGELCGEMELNLDDVERASALDLDFHRAVAQATKNPLHILVLETIADALLEIRRDTFGPHGRARAALVSHRALLRRIRRRDVEGARKLMAGHLEDVARYWITAYGSQGKR